MQSPTSENSDFSEKFLQLQLDKFCKTLIDLHLNTYTYGVEVKNPYAYAFEPYSNFVRKYLNGKKDVLFLGMNPSPSDMGRNGIPFGDIDFVVEWLGVTGRVSLPNLNPMCSFSMNDLSESRSENAECDGKALWSLIQELTITPESFFANCFVHNFCPLLFTKDGKNVTPEDLEDPDDKSNLEQICGRYLQKTLKLLDPRIIIAVGTYAKTQAFTFCNPWVTPIIIIPYPPKQRLYANLWRNKVISIFKKSPELNQIFSQLDYLEYL